MTSLNGTFEDLSPCMEQWNGNGDILKDLNIPILVEFLQSTRSNLTSIFNSLSLTEFEEKQDYLRYFVHQHKVFEDYGIIYFRDDFNFNVTDPTTIGSSRYFLDYIEANIVFQNFSNILKGNISNDA